MTVHRASPQDEKAKANPYPEQDAEGVDLSLIRENLRLSPLERIRRADQARRDALRVQEIGRQHRERQIKRGA